MCYLNTEVGGSVDEVAPGNVVLMSVFWLAQVDSHPRMLPRFYPTVQLR
jgi:hypothetical protein